MTGRPVYDGAGQRVRYFAGPVRKRAKSTKPRQHPEDDLQAATVRYLTWALPPRVLWTATLNGAHLGPKERMRMKQNGMRRGISDFVLADPGRGAFFIEMKPPDRIGQPKRFLSPEQEHWAAALEKRWKTCRTLQDVEAALLYWGIQPIRSIEEANRYTDLGEPL